MMAALDLESSSLVDNDRLAVNMGGGSTNATVGATPLSARPTLLNAVSYQGELLTKASNNQKMESVIIILSEKTSVKKLIWNEVNFCLRG